MKTKRPKQSDHNIYDRPAKSISWLYLPMIRTDNWFCYTIIKNNSQTTLPLCHKSSFNRLNFRGAVFVILSVAKYHKKG
jgi:hypothetical protein